MKITVFTPTYNRAYIIETLYRSLQRQTFTDFEWLVVDDGSSDGTEELFSQWSGEETRFPIRYYKQPNGGKHRAINRGITLASGTIFYIVDSDDWLPKDSLEIIEHEMSILPLNGLYAFAGVCGCRGYRNGQVIGRTFEGDYLDCTALERVKHGIEGDKAEAFFTDILRKYPFPEFEGENFLTEAIVWDKMAADGYCLRFFNKVVYLCEYREDGLTHQGLDLYYRNPKGYGLYLRMAREYRKFSRPLSDYLDAECYYHWKKTMTVSEIAELIGTRRSKLLYTSYYLLLRERASKAKRSLLRWIRREHSHDT